MKILHYTLGLFPYRSGGLTKYSQDLILAQKKEENEVILLFPGDINNKYPKTNIIKQKDWEGIDIYEIKNPLPIPLLYGIKSPKAFINSNNIDIKDFTSFLDKVSPDIFHIHTLMGLPIEYLQIAKKRGIKLVYTTHDYFGLCPKVNFINNYNEYCRISNPQKCAECNRTASSTFFLRIRNSKILTLIKKWK